MSSHSNSRVTELNSAQIEEFTASLGVERQIGKRARAYGLTVDGEVAGVALLSNPVSTEHQSLYTTELIALELEDTSDQRAASELLGHYSGLPRSVDFFAREEVFPAAIDPLSLGLTPAEGPSGELIYEWRSDSRYFYLYRISSTADDGYYIGRHGSGSGSPEAMLQDGYMGSGGVKFKNWVAAVGKSTLRKEILEVHSRWSDSVEAETRLIGDRHRSDPRCKNSKPGGTGLGSYIPDYTVEICPVHGESKFRGGCKRCSLEASKSLKACSVHGETLHIGESCYKCTTKKKWEEKECLIHGLTLHNGSTCQKCASTASVELKSCPVHGATLHRGSSCLTCIAESSVSVRECPIHGAVKHVGEHCRTCLNRETMSEQECEIHGVTRFKGDSCVQCSAAKVWTTEECAVHGISKHRSGVCQACTAQSRAQKERNDSVDLNCPTHGLTPHLNGKCKRCKAQKQVTMGNCSTHGETKFNGDTCGKCAVAKIWTVQLCSVHGESKHRSGKCEQCSRAARSARKALEARS